MTHFGNHEWPQPLQQPTRGMPRWLLFAIAGLIFSVPVTGLSLMAWPYVQQHTDIVLGHVELICLAGVILLIGGVLAAYALRDRGGRL